MVLSMAAVLKQVLQLLAPILHTQQPLQLIEEQTRNLRWELDLELQNKFKMIWIATSSAQKNLLKRWILSRTKGFQPFLLTPQPKEPHHPTKNVFISFIKNTLTSKKNSQKSYSKTSWKNQRRTRTNKRSKMSTKTLKRLLMREEKWIINTWKKKRGKIEYWKSIGAQLQKETLAWWKKTLRYLARASSIFCRWSG